MQIVEIQRRYFASHATLDPAFRRRQLEKLRGLILKNEKRISAALWADLSKSPHESYLTETGIVLSEISYTLRHLERWCRPRRVSAGIACFGDSAQVYPQPYGCVLIVAPFNYPLQLALMPLVSALAAGNCAVIKPSELAPHTAALLGDMIGSAFDPGLCAVVQGGAQAASKLFYAGFDALFFTGGQRVGRLAYRAAAEQMIPVTLELGGKSPCIVDQTANLDLAARRIVWGKWLNAGQTCVAPDYLLVDEAVRLPLLRRMQRLIRTFYSDAPQNNPAYPKIISKAHFDRLHALLSDGVIYCGGQSNPQTRRIAPTIIQQVPSGSPLLTEEIFGPILPVLPFYNQKQLLGHLARCGKPLALYLFTADRALARKIIREIPFGGGCINDTVMQLCPSGLPFGGIGPSGLGSYHGKAGFDRFCHQKSVLHAAAPDLPLRYPPYGAAPKLLRRILR